MNQKSDKNPSAWRRLALASVGLLLLLTLAGAACEAAGWPFLARPAERWLSQRLERTVTLTNPSGSGFRLQLLGRVDLQLEHLRIDQPRGFTGGALVDARAVLLQLDWTDLLRWRRSEPLHLRVVSAKTLQLDLQRNDKGLANWQNQAAPTPRAEQTLGKLFNFGRLSVEQGQARVADAPLQLALDARFGLQEGDGGTATANAGLSASASGSLRQLPLQASLRTGSSLPWVGGDDQAPAVPVQLKLQVGRALLDFDGSVRDLLGQRGLSGAYRVRGPSMADVGAPLRLTLPATPRFAMRGRLTRQGTRWLTVVDEATVGHSRLAGEFSFDTPPESRPLLAGRLHGAVLQLQDLGPALGAKDPEQAAGARTAPAGRVLPDRRFDLPSLRAMDANVLVDIQRLDFGTPLLQAAAPLRAHLLLEDGVFRVQGLDARLAQGRLSGQMQLDGRAPVATWSADLQLRGVRLEQALRAVQRPGQPPYASGLLSGRAMLAGRGRSTAEWLASADGRVLARWTQGKVSHLLVEVAGLDVAQGLGLLLRGDDALTVDCGAADLRVTDGRVTPQVLVVDTRDSLLWLGGGLSLVDERLDLVAHVQPKDFSPLTLRTPLRIGGTLGAPTVTLEKGPLLRRVVPAALLAMLNPLAALLPLLDAGQTDQAAAAGCQALQQPQRKVALP